MFQVNVPAPKATLAIPRHNDRTPSAEDIRETAFAIPVYTADGAGLTICIRV